MTSQTNIVPEKKAKPATQQATPTPQPSSEQQEQQKKDAHMQDLILKARVEAARNRIKEGLRYKAGIKQGFVDPKRVQNPFGEVLSPEDKRIQQELTESLGLVDPKKAKRAVNKLIPELNAIKKADKLPDDSVLMLDATRTEKQKIAAEDINHSILQIKEKQEGMKLAAQEEKTRREKAQNQVQEETALAEAGVGVEQNAAWEDLARLGEEALERGIKNSADYTQVDPSRLDDADFIKLYAQETVRYEGDPSQATRRISTVDFSRRLGAIRNKRIFGTATKQDEENSIKMMNILQQQGVPMAEVLIRTQQEAGTGFKEAFEKNSSWFGRRRQLVTALESLKAGGQGLGSLLTSQMARMARDLKTGKRAFTDKDIRLNNMGKVFARAHVTEDPTTNTPFLSGEIPSGQYKFELAPGFTSEEYQAVLGMEEAEIGSIPDELSAAEQEVARLNIEEKYRVERRKMTDTLAKELLQNEVVTFKDFREKMSAWRKAVLSSFTGPTGLLRNQFGKLDLKGDKMGEMMQGGVIQTHQQLIEYANMLTNSLSNIVQTRASKFVPISAPDFGFNSVGLDKKVDLR